VITIQKHEAYKYKASKYENSVIYAQKYIECPLHYTDQRDRSYKHASKNLHRLLNAVKTHQAVLYRYLILVISMGILIFKV